MITALALGQTNMGSTLGDRMSKKKRLPPTDTRVQKRRQNKQGIPRTVSVSRARELRRK